jgi:protein-disulfide isomerase
MTKKDLKKRLNEDLKTESVGKENHSSYSLVMFAQIIGVVLIFLVIVLLLVFVNNVSVPTFAIDGRTIGNADAPVEVIVWSDFQCPFCSQFATDIMPSLEKDYVSTGKVKISYKYFLGHTDSKRAAMAAECANEQGKFWEYHDLVYKNSDISEKALKSYAISLSLNSSQFNDCYGSEKYGRAIEKEFMEGINIGVKGTPSVFINGTFIEGLQSYSSYKMAIDFALK